eukprot:TRINITY_DN9885_c0_g1_i1.p2 TRINITY_DN9885_c0_g1~~TRINITY_DN9885_c0_g1_i1.p2  ORF type:complete len:297 (-),score=47.39 TRINITY_DN9885_c0_g1_i1:358-1248(-)
MDLLGSRWSSDALAPGNHALSPDDFVPSSRCCLIEATDGRPLSAQMPCNPQDAQSVEEDGHAAGRSGSARSTMDVTASRWLVCMACLGGDPSRLSRGERARHAILSWRLTRPYLAYCIACSFVTALLLFYNVSKGMKNNWNLPQWKHHRWEEFAEVGLGVLMVTETALTIRVLGVRTFFKNACCVCDFVVAVLTAVSIGYGLEHLGAKGEICEADVPLLLLRFALQPSRVLAAMAVTYRTCQMQSQVDELRVDFDALPGGVGGGNFLDIEMHGGSSAGFEALHDDDCAHQGGPFGW